MILDSGTRREFDSGAVRDVQEGKGRCDLLPLDVVRELFDWACDSRIIHAINTYKNRGDHSYLFNALDEFIEAFCKEDIYTALLEVSIHFEEGCKKYGEDNWQKGIPTKCYVDSAVRHYLKFRRGDTDERHDRAFMWNLMCCIWTCVNKPELNSYKKDISGGKVE